MTDVRVETKANVTLGVVDEGVVLVFENGNIKDLIRLRSWAERGSIMKQVEEFLDAHDPTPKEGPS